MLNGWQSRVYLVNQGHWDHPVSVGRYGTFPFIDPLFVKIANAALRGEQRIPPKLNHCAVNT
ncbi:hypothetical protein TUM4442_23740 [Shewanella algae]|nr:hypothetical protein TUM4442_23740 [Shewanella algae]